MQFAWSKKTLNIKKILQKGSADMIEKIQPKDKW